MKILDLQLRAFGPFTERHLDLSAGREGLHLVFGPNEAGKSSALRALKALLYGIPERTPDAFLHANPELRIGGRFRAADGAELVCYRRKGRKNTLLGGDDQPIPEDALTSLLRGVDERRFERLFGIDHESLVSGGQTLLAEGGREAETLFGAGLGGSAIRAVLDALDQEAAGLFAPRASKPRVNATLSQLADTQKRLREISLSARHWDETRKALGVARQRLADLDETLAAASRRRGTLERIRRTLPGLAQRGQILDRLQCLGDLPRLAAGFGQQREEATAKRRRAVEGQIRANGRLADLREKTGVLAVSEELLAQAEAIDDLREQLGSYRKAALDRPALAIKEAAQREQARHRLAAIRPDLALTDSERLRPLLGRRRRAAELGGRRDALEAAVKVARATLAETGQALEDKRTALSSLPASPFLEDLQRAVAAARRAGDLDREVAEAARRLRQHLETCARGLGALGLWTGDLAALRAAALPGGETLRKFSADFQILDDEARRLDQVRAQAQAERRRTEESLRALQLAGAVPSEEELREARAHRGHGWQLLKRQWLDGVDVSAEAQQYGQGAALPEAFEGAVATTDAVADRLRREAQRVHEQAAARARLDSTSLTLAETAAAQARLTDQRQALDQDWLHLWSACGVSARSPREMGEWLETAVRLREKAGEGDELGARLDVLQQAREVQRRSLNAALTALGNAGQRADPDQALTPLLDFAESCLKALEAARQRRVTLEGEIAELEVRRQRQERDLATAEAEFTAWRVAWAALMVEFGLARDASPGAVAEDLQAIADILNLIDEASGLQVRVAGIDADAVTFAQRATELLTRLASDLLGRPVEEAVLQLHQRLGKQRETKSRLEELLAQIRQAEQEAREAEAVIQAADEVLGTLCRQAGCDQPDQLPAVEARVREQGELSEQLRRVETELIEGGDGLGLDALSGEAAAVDRDAVMTELSAVKARIEQELQPERERLLAVKINAERDFAAMAGGDAAAALAEDVEHTLSDLRAYAARYVRVKLAGRVLRDEIERFRRQHRDPILSGASGHFAQLTCHSFAAVETDFDESDQPVLVGVRPGGERLRVEAMSTGTRDQLYLALRLATLEHDLDGADPFPFIVDDILVQFDDARAHATLNALADLSARTQVILFTHHGRVVEQASALDRAGERVFVHALG